MFSDAFNYFANTSIAEIFAVITALAYVILAARGSLWCWPAAMISTVLYTVIFYEYYLWSDSALQVYYFAMAVFGWVNWQKNKQKQQSDQIEIETYSTSFHLKAIGVLSVLSIALGMLMDNFTPTHFPYLDAATTVFAVFATYLVAKRVLENWLYWIVIDLVSIYLYHAKELNPTAVLFMVYVVLATVAYFSWRRTLLAQSPKPKLAHAS